MNIAFSFPIVRSSQHYFSRGAEKRDSERARERVCVCERERRESLPFSHTKVPYSYTHIGEFGRTKEGGARKE